MDEVELQSIATRILQESLGADARFREGQLEAIEAVVRDRARALVVQRTGWGKSLVYFVATRILRSRGEGPTLLISPLLSLIRNQIAAADRMGVRAHAIHSNNIEDWKSVEQALLADECDLLLVSPERLSNERFRTEVLTRLPNSVGLFVVDEAHCISDWGHDFRPDYRRIVGLLRLLPKSVPVLATTATANDRVIRDICDQVDPELRVLRGALVRESLRLQVLRLESHEERLAWLAEMVPSLPGSGIIYVLTVRDAEVVAAWLRDRGIEARAYSSRLTGAVREALEDALLQGRVKALVATVALGMGFDKPDLGFVVHYQRPGSLIAYYQQIGRAGRAMDSAYAVLLAGEGDGSILEYFMAQAFPPESMLQEVLQAIEKSNGLRILELAARVNLSRRRVEQCVKILEVEGAIVRNGSTLVRTARRWLPDRARIERVTAQRRHEYEMVEEYLSTERCLMMYVAEQLDDVAAKPCERCANCSGPVVPLEPRPELIAKARRFLEDLHVEIEPRREWPVQLAAFEGRRIDPSLRAACGRALCRYNERRLGKMIHDNKYVHGRFQAELADALVALVQADWRPVPSPRWVTFVPSPRHPRLVADLAGMVAERLGLPLLEALEAVDTGFPQKSMQSAAQQVRNAYRGMRVVPARVVQGEPVLLIDDIVDSRWTMTVASALLRKEGAGPVFPLALACASGSSS